MDISQDFIIDTVLNAAGYLTSAILSIVVYSLFFRRNRSQNSPGSHSVPAATTQVVIENGTQSAGEVEFIKLGGDNIKPTNRPGSESVFTSAGQPGAGRRDRTSIVRIATKMLKAGAGIDKIKHVLPISEAELSLIKQSQNI